MGNDSIPLTRKEREMVQQIAEREGMTEDEAATRLVQRSLARRVKKRTGKVQARVYQLRKKFA